MKEVLIYGALVAAVLGVSTTLITNLTGGLGEKASEVNTTIDTRIDALMDIGAPATN